MTPRLKLNMDANQNIIPQAKECLPTFSLVNENGEPSTTGSGLLVAKNPASGEVSSICSSSLASIFYFSLNHVVWILLLPNHIYLFSHFSL